MTVYAVHPPVKVLRGEKGPDAARDLITTLSYVEAARSSVKKVFRHRNFPLKKEISKGTGVVSSFTRSVAFFVGTIVLSMRASSVTRMSKPLFAR